MILAAGMKGIEQGDELPLEAPPSMTGFTEHGGLIDQAQLPQSLDEALVHGGISNNVRVKLERIDSEHLDPKKVEPLLKNISGVLIPGGFGK